MAGLTWFELDVDFHDDPKIKELASRLRQPLADSYVSRLYAYCYKHATDRFPPESAASTIEDICRWKGRRGVLFDALFAVEVLERDAGKVVVHGVKARLGPHLAKRVVDAERQKRHRDKAAASIGRNGAVTGDVTRDDTRESRGNKDKDRDKDQKQEKLAAVAGATPPLADPAKTKPDEKRDAARRTLSDALVAVYAVERGGGYGWDGVKDGQGLARLLGWSRDVDEHTRRFRLALREPPGNYSFRVDTVAQFATGRIWNHFAAAPKQRTHGDLGAELRPWQTRLTDDERPQAWVEWREAVKADPEFTDAPLGIMGVNTSPAYEAICAFNAKWRAIAEAKP